MLDKRFNIGFCVSAMAILGAVAHYDYLGIDELIKGLLRLCQGAIHLVRSQGK